MTENATPGAPPAASPSVLLDEMTLYYEEVRDVNQRAMVYVKIVGFVIAGLCSYMFFGLRYSCEVRLMAKDADAAAKVLMPVIPAYAGLGIVIAALLFVLNCFCIRLYARSKQHKTRYWRSVSILREHLHSVLGLLHNGRAIPLQTGLEEAVHTPFVGEVPRPFIRKQDRFAGVFMAITALILFAVPLLIFVTFWRLSQTELKMAFWEAWRDALVYSVPGLAAAMVASALVAHGFWGELLAAQFISPSSPDPTLERREPFLAERVVMVAIGALTYGGIIIFIIWSWAVDSVSTSQWYVIAWVLLGMIALERSLNGIIRRWDSVCWYIMLLRLLARWFGPKSGVRSRAWLAALHGEDKARLIWQRYESSRTIRLRKRETE